MLRGYGEKGTLLEMQVGTAIVENSITSVQWFSHVQLHDPMDCSMPGFSVHHQLMELAQTHVHQVGDVIPFSSCLESFPASDLFQGISSSCQVAEVLEFQLQHESFQWIFRTDFLSHWLIVSPCNSRDSQESSPTPQFKSINSLVISFLSGLTLTFIHDYWKKQSFD